MSINPTECDAKWLYSHLYNERTFEYPEYGEWMLFYKKEQIDDAWKLANELYKKNKLTPVIKMKCSGNEKDSYVICFYTDKALDQVFQLKHAEKIVKALNYKNNDYICYKRADKKIKGSTYIYNIPKDIEKILCELEEWSD